MVGAAFRLDRALSISCAAHLISANIVLFLSTNKSCRSALGVGYCTHTGPDGRTENICYHMFSQLSKRSTHFFYQLEVNKSILCLMSATNDFCGFLTLLSQNKTMCTMAAGPLLTTIRKIIRNLPVCANALYKT